MKSKLTPLFSKFVADDVKSHFSEEANVYIGIGRVTSFGSSSSNVEDVLFTTNKINDIYRNLVGLKKIQAADMQLVAPRYDWTANLVYDAYRDDQEIFSYEDTTILGTANANANTTLTGTVNIAASNVVVGNGTTFGTFIFAGDQIAVNLAVKTVVSVTNNDHLVVNSAFANTNTGGSIVLVSNNRIVVGNSASFSGLSVGNTISIGEDTREVTGVRSSKVISLNTALTYSNSNVNISVKSNTYPLVANNFYVRNTRDQIFKCLFNNSRANSTIEPTIDIDGQLPENPFILTSDGYKWKYLYTIAPGLKQKFFTDRWMPVANDASVTAAAVEGRVDIINVLWGGSGILGGGNSNTAAILSITNTDGSGANLIARVSNGAITSVTVLSGGNNYTRGTVTLTSAAEQLGNSTIGGTVNVSGTTITANLANTSNQAFTGNVFVNDIVTINNESRNVVTVVNSTSIVVNTAFNVATSQVMTIQRSAPQFDIEFPPFGGHGHFPAEEIGARTMMITMELNGDESGTIPVSDGVNTFDFNQISIIQDPKIANNAYVANGTNYRVSTRVFVSDPGVSNFIDDETVYIGTSLATATMVANVAHWDFTNNYLYINNITGPVASEQVIKGDTSGTTTTILEVLSSEVKLFTGDLLFVDNRKNVSRSVNQIEQVKVVLTF